MTYTPATQEEAVFLASYDPSKFPITVVTVDVVAVDARTDSVLMIRRGGFPYKGSLALPGGFIDQNETTLESARRELLEETGIGLSLNEISFLGAADAPGRDPRGRAISFVFLAVISAEEHDIKAGDDATEVVFLPIADVKNTPIAFDHAMWIEEAADHLEVVR